jgi:hypothetical protein
VGKSAAEVREALRLAIGPRRWQALQGCFRAVAEGSGGLEPAYALPGTPEEARLVLSLDLDVSRALGEAAVEAAAAACAQTGARIAELGCGAGGLATWLAQRFPQAIVTAYDRAGALLRAARSLPDAARVTVVEADWTRPRLAPSGPHDVLLCVLGVDHIGPPPALDLRPAYASRLHAAREHFRGWAALAASSRTQPPSIQGLVALAEPYADTTCEHDSKTLRYTPAHK